MLGPEKVRRLDRPILTSLEALVPSGNFSRHLDATLDLSFVREWVKDCYAGNGRPSIDPVVFFRLQLVMFFEGIRSERQLMRLAADRLSARWYVGYALDEPLPDHSSLTRIRQRLGLPVFRRFFDHVVDLCQEAGLVWGRQRAERAGLFFDATKVRANAAVDSLVPRLQVVAREHLDEIFAGDEAQPTDREHGAAVVDTDVGVRSGTPALAPTASEDQTEDSPGGPSVVASVPAEGDGPTTGEQPSRWNLLDECRLDPNRPEINYYRRKADLCVSTTDADATPMRAGYQRASLGYHDHYCVDGGRARIILHALVTPADVMENEPMLDVLRRVTFRWHLHPRRAIADTTYGTVENIRALEDAGIRAYVPLPDFDSRTSSYGTSLFTYDAERDEYRCPQGQPLARYSRQSAEEIVKYRADAATCNACPVKAACTASEHGRTVSRSFYEGYLERVRAYHDTPAYQRAMRKRKVWPEPLFAEAKQWHGLRQFRSRGLSKVNIEALVVATGQNLKRWLAASGWGRRHAPCGSLQHPNATFSRV